MANKKSKITDSNHIANLEKIVTELTSDANEQEQANENIKSPYIVHNYCFPADANAFSEFAGGTVFSRRHCQVKEIYRTRDGTRSI